MPWMWGKSPSAHLQPQKIVKSCVCLGSPSARGVHLLVLLYSITAHPALPLASDRTACLYDLSWGINVTYLEACAQAGSFIQQSKSS